MMKGITQVISSVILLLITVSIAGASWSFLQGVFSATVSDSFYVAPGGAYCVNDRIIVYVVNTGSDLLEPADFNLLAVDSIPATASFPPIPPGKAGKVL
ncbi:MAG: hypothetical protein HY369_01555, partial [Candidatus Aenigmarchaeota archaeon]|nr:hypothetical protein [Candidatus Aenigmarchaeota archaeon]